MRNSKCVVVVDLALILVVSLVAVNASSGQGDRNDAKELLAKHPDLKGFEGSSVVDVAGIGRAVREAGFQGKTCVMGTSLPSVAGEFLDDGAVDKIFLWDPLVAGQAQDKLALMLIKGEKIAPGLDLGLPGYRNLKRIPGTPHGLAGSGWIAIDKSNMRQYPF